jgi:hypothetical protein
MLKVVAACVGALLATGAAAQDAVHERGRYLVDAVMMARSKLQASLDSI